jgi:hypothetical protein
LRRSRSGEKQESPSAPDDFGVPDDFGRDFDVDKPYDEDDGDVPGGMPDFSKIPGLDKLGGMEQFGNDFSKLPGMEQFGKGKKFGDFDD